MDEYHIRACAKINLSLDVTGRLPNGYHEVRMVMQTVDICDELFLERASEGVALTTDCEELPTDKNNLICKAVLLMRERCGFDGGVRIHLKKRIPVAAGMAGGSSDAAAAMKGICRLFDLNVSPDRLAELGVIVGADVPYCLMGGTALAEGIGERLTPLPPAPACHILVAKPGVSVSTKYVYEHLDAAGLTFHPDIDGMCSAVRQGSLQGILDRMGNVLETVTVPAFPVVGSLKRRMLELGARAGLMSGSGPTVFGIFPDGPAARLAGQKLREEGLAEQIFVTTPV